MSFHWPYTFHRLWDIVTGRSHTGPSAECDYLNYKFGAHLGLSLEDLCKLMEPGSLPPRFRYRHFTVKKKDGNPREIFEPGPDLKAAQRQILRRYLNKVGPHPAAVGFRRGKSIADHAWAHAGAAIIVTADIQDFFPSTSRHRVKAWWGAQGFGKTEVRFLTRLTNYRGSLPQGAPTSPALSNLVNYDLDVALQKRARQSAGVYTRYCDDLAFSWPDGCDLPSGFEPAVCALLREAGYRLHPHKGWRVWQRRDEPEIAGLILTRRGGVDIPPGIKRLMRLLARSKDPLDAARLAGYESYRAMVKRT